MRGRIIDWYHSRKGKFTTLEWLLIWIFAIIILLLAIFAFVSLELAYPNLL
ncbi:hypothetical protein [Pilibacter termitis]|uniref:hypothetical protein n=1 Tax=Pilibacter termitis TaxID=263852 RepID=UPI0013563DBE|nr:hypothetical protein [Pilibacter termitis]